MSYVDSVREGRSSPSVLVADIVKIRGRRPDDPIFIFEGTDDVGVFQEWLRMISAGFVYQCIPGKGKGQLLKLLDRFRIDENSYKRRVWLFVDRDFDGLRGRLEGSEIYVCKKYSIENYLVSDLFVREYLVDELRCATDVGCRDDIIDRFGVFLESLKTSIGGINKRLFIARAAGIQVTGKKEKLGPYLKIEMDASTWIGVEADVVALEREPTEAEVREYAEKFDRMNHLDDYRGKWLFWAFKKWLGLIYEDRRSDRPKYFSQSSSELGSSPLTLDMRSFACRSIPPDCLRAFMEGVHAECL